jgi:signal transduction histidine kinase
VTHGRSTTLRSSARRPDRLRWPARADYLLAGACCVLGQIEVIAAGADPVDALCAALATLPIAWQQRAPLAAAVTVAVSWLIFKSWNGFPVQPAFFFFAALPVIYSLGAHSRLGRAVTGAGIVVVTVEVTDLLGIGDDYAFLAFVIALMWLSGRGTRVYREQSEQLRTLVSRLEVERADSERLAVAEERLRMTGALHSTIEQAVSRMLVYADRAEQLMGEEIGRVRAVLAVLQDTGRQAIAELHQILGVLRTVSNRSTPAATPGPTAMTEQRQEGLLAGFRWIDLGWAVALTAAFDTQQILREPVGGTQAAIAGSAAMACLAMAFRRATPVAAFALAAAVMAGSLLPVGGVRAYSPAVALMVTMYAAAAHVPLRRALTVGVIAILVGDGVTTMGIGPVNVPAVTTLLALVWVCGRCVRTYRHRTEQLRTVTVRLAGERDARARLAVLDERARVARDLHDSIAHAVNVMVLQAGAAELTIETAPEAALTAIHAVQAQGAQARRDLHPLLDRDGEDDSDEIARDLSQLDTLIAHAGLPITLHVHGLLARLPATVSRSAYRIVQEGLTNTLKHAGPVPASVTLDCRAGSLGIEIRDRGGAEPRGRAGPIGHGLLGMRERITGHGGTLEAGPDPGGGFVVRAHIPLASVLKADTAWSPTGPECRPLGERTVSLVHQKISRPAALISVDRGLKPRSGPPPAE